MFPTLQIRKGYEKRQNGEQGFCSSSLAHVSDPDVSANLNKKCEKL